MSSAMNVTACLPIQQGDREVQPIQAFRQSNLEIGLQIFKKITV